jgi:hypothetical protein
MLPGQARRDWHPRLHRAPSTHTPRMMTSGSGDHSTKRRNCLTGAENGQNFITGGRNILRPSFSNLAISAGLELPWNVPAPCRFSTSSRLLEDPVAEHRSIPNLSESDVLCPSEMHWRHARSPMHPATWQNRGLLITKPPSGSTGNLPRACGVQTFQNGGVGSTL